MYYAFAGIMVGLGIWNLAMTYWWTAFLSLAMAYVFGTWPRIRANAYRYGWLSGRNAMIGSILEAQDRGMRFTEWLDAEAERDGIRIVNLKDE